MRVLAITGVPGTGKTTIAAALGPGFTVVSANQLAAEVGAIVDRDIDRQADIVDEERLHERARSALSGERVVIEGGLAHACDPDAVVVLRCEPTVLRQRLSERGWSEAKVEENVMAEILDAVSLDVDTEPAWELDTTDLTPQEAAGHIAALFNGEDLTLDQVAPLGGFDWTDHLMGAEPG